MFPPKNSEKIHILIILIVDYLLTPSVSMFIAQGLSLEARHAAQAERRAANTATAAASEAAAAVASCWCWCLSEIAKATLVGR